MPPESSERNESWPAGASEMAGRIRRFDWAATSLGPSAAWSERLKAAIELMLATPLISSIVVGPSRILIYNDAAARLYRDGHPVALGHPLSKMFPAGFETVQHLYDRVFAGESVSVAEQPLDTRNEGVITDYFDAWLTPVRDAQGVVIAAQMLGFEVSERVTAQSALREKEARLRRAISVQKVGVLLFDLAGHMREANAAFEQMCGYTVDELRRTTHWSALTAPEYHDITAQRAQELAAHGETTPYEKQMIRKDGSRWWGLFAPTRLSGSGTQSECVEFVFDISETKRSEAALRDSELERSFLISNMSDGFCILEVILDEAGNGVDYRFLETNPAFVRQGGFDPAGRLMSEIAPIEPIWPTTYGRVATTGIPERIVDAAASFGRVYDVYAFRIGAPADRRIAVFFTNITERKRAEEAIRVSEESFRALATSGAFMLYRMSPDWRIMYQLSGHNLLADTLEPIENWADNYILEEDRAEIDVAIAHAIRNKTAFDLEHRVRTADGGVGWVRSRAVPICGPDGTITEWFGSGFDIGKRKEAEAALRESEERFRQFADASSDVLWIRDGETLTATYISSAANSVYGAVPERLIADRPFFDSLVVPDDRDAMIAQLRDGQKGEATVAEFRVFRPSDSTFRWIRRTAFPLRDLKGDVQSVAGISSDTTEEKLLQNHQDVLLAELQHRVRNIMAIIRSIVTRTAQGAESTADYVDLLSGRLLTLARVQALLTRAANVGIAMSVIVNEELAAQATRAEQFVVAGPEVVLSPKAAETMTLAIHELTTNALKHGALASAGGKIEVRWVVFENGGMPWLRFQWLESGSVARDTSGPRRTGFGRELIEGRVPYELGGHGTLTIAPRGAQCCLEFPLEDGTSVLETDAPQRATVFGGAIDMAGYLAGHSSLSGQRVLVLEDDYFLATDTARALKSAGADVLGPCNSEESARREIANSGPTCAVLDINLDGSRSFGLARELKSSGTPVLFITGYDQDIIPNDLRTIARLQKPFKLRDVVTAVALAVGL